MADDDDVRGAPGPEELLAPTGPRRSSFTPAPNDAESLEAAANLFNDDAIAAALSAELARVASGPIPTQRPAASPPATEEAPVAAEAPVVDAVPAPVTAVEHEPPATPQATAVPEAVPVPEATAAPGAAAQPSLAAPATQPGPPDWASSLFGQPQPPAQAEAVQSAAPAADPFAPSAPSFAPSSGPFPPPADQPAEGSPPEAPSAFPVDEDSLRALYSAAPAPTVPAADAPPPPGYGEPGGPVGAPSVPSAGEPSDLRPRRRALEDDESPTRNAIEELQAQLDKRDREAREYAAWEASMLEVGSPESLSSVEEARAERAGMAGPASPSMDAPAPPAEEPATFLPPPAEEPAAFLPPPAEEPVAFLPPPAEEPAAFLPPPAEEPAAFLPPPAEDAAAFLPPPEEEPAFLPSLPSDAAAPFPGFAPPTDASAIDFAAPADPRELSFDQPPLPDSPVFLEPALLASPPPAPPSWNLDDAPPEPPALVEPLAPDGLAELWRTASRPETVPASAAPAAIPVDSPAPEALPAPPGADVSPAPPEGVASGFDDLLAGSADAPDPQPPSPAWVAGEPNPFTEPAIDASTGDRRPFGEGVDRDKAVDPSDSILGAPPAPPAPPAPVSVSTAGVAVVPERVSPDPEPISVLNPTEPAARVAPPIAPAERVGLEPTPAEQRVGRAARLFWLWFAANSSIVAIVFGMVIFALGVNLRQAIVATLAGVALSFLPLGLGTLVGKRSGLPTMVISRATFGVVGNVVPSLIGLFSRLIWAAALLWVLGAGTADILTGARLTDGFTTGQLTMIAMGVGFVLAVVLAFFGYGLIAKVQLVISVISGIAIVGFIALTFHDVNYAVAVSIPDGPWILVVSGAVLVFSFVGLAWANSSSDLARYQRPESSGSASGLWASFGVALPSFILISYGALLAASDKTLAAQIATDPLDALARLLPAWYPGPLLAATVLSLLSGIVLALYSGGFALQAVGLQLRRSLSTLIVGLLMFLITIILSNSLTDFGQLFRDVATTVAVPIAAWAGIFGAEVMIRKRRFDSYSLLNRGGVYADARWSNLVALVVVSAIGYGFLSATMPALSWEGYLFTAIGVPVNGQLAASDLGVLVALLLGLLVPLAIGHSGIRAQEKASRDRE